MKFYFPTYCIEGESSFANKILNDIIPKGLHYLSGDVSDFSDIPTLKYFYYPESLTGDISAFDNMF